MIEVPWGLLSQNLALCKFEMEWTMDTIMDKRMQSREKVSVNV